MRFYTDIYNTVHSVSKSSLMTPVRMAGEVEQIDKLMNELRLLDQKNPNTYDLRHRLDSLVNASKVSISEFSEFAVDDVFLQLLQHWDKEVVVRAARAIAEIARTNHGREKCSNKGVVAALMELLMEDRVDVLTQASRALGNICYENDEGKQYVEDRDGLTCILNVLERGVLLGNTDEGAPFLRNVAAGLLWNFLVDRPGLHNDSLKDRTVPIITRLLHLKDCTETEAALHCLLVLGILNDSDILFLDESLTRALVSILGGDVSFEVAEKCLEILYAQAEGGTEETKLLMAETGVCGLLLRMLEEHTPDCADDESKAILKVACNLLVVILTGDASMSLIYENASGPVYQKLLALLDSQDIDLQISTVRAIGNFARTDAHCKQMVQQGMHKRLLGILEVTKQVRLQQALLCALRNLVIFTENKKIALMDGLVDVLYPILDTDCLDVLFKLLGTLRIAIDGDYETTKELGRREDLIKRAVKWSTTEGYPGIRDEAARLLAVLVITSKDKETCICITKNGAAEPLLRMVRAQHALMRNSALVSLTILATIDLRCIEDLLLSNSIGKSIAGFFNEEQIDKATTRNSAALAESALPSDNLKKHFQSSGVPESCRRAIEYTKDDASLRHKLQSLLDRLTQ